MSEQTYSLCIAELHEQYRSGVLTSEVLFADIKTKIESYKENNIWIHLLDENELQIYFSNLQGKGPDDLPLYGIPFAIKDNIDLAGIPTTAGCPEYSYIPEKSAFVVQLLIDAGAIPIGKTNLDQFAAGLVGIRSPYGAVKNPFDPDYISGGSSSGSAVAVALGLVSFSLGTDTAGSGRVPAAFNNLVGLKPTRGVVSASGVVPACRSLDCVCLFTLNLDDASSIYNIIDKYDSSDSYARHTYASQETRAIGTTIGIPNDSQLEFFGDSDYRELFKRFIETLKERGYEVITIDFEPFIKTAELLYHGPWLAERYAGIKTFIETKADALFPVTREIISAAKTHLTVDAFNSMYELQEFKNQTDAILENVDSILIPTAGTIYRIDEVEQQPIQLNSNLGYYTNFMNLLDYAAVALPAGFTDHGLPFGVTLFSRAFTDHQLLKHANLILQGQSIRMGAMDYDWVPNLKSNKDTIKDYFIDVAVCGAHLSGMPLNHQLTDRQACLVKKTSTAPSYRFYVLPGGPPYRPGLVKDDAAGTSIEVEVWRMPLATFGEFMQDIPAPLGIGTIILIDGEETKGFICEGYAIEGAEDITHLGSWRNYIASIV